MNLDAIPIGNTPEDINVVIEVPIGGEPIKYELDKTAGTLFIDRFEHYKDFEAGKWVKLVGLASVPRRF